MSEQTSFFRTHLLVIPGALALAALLAHHSGIDRALDCGFLRCHQCPFPGACIAHCLSCWAIGSPRTVVTVVWLALACCRDAEYACHGLPLAADMDRANAGSCGQTVMGMALGATDSSWA